jgi:hypothetical protein
MIEERRPEFKVRRQRFLQAVSGLAAGNDLVKAI